MDWIGSYLRDRRFSVRVRGFISGWFDVLSGVPQGSSFGPLLFLIFINDLLIAIPEILFLLYADDAKIARAIRSESDFLELRRAFHVLTLWAENNGLRINFDKTKVISFFQRRCLFSPFDYSLDHSTISRVDEIRDLGVIFDSELTFKSHIASVVAKASRMLGLVTRNSSEFRDHAALLQLYRAHVIPILTYASVIWTPSLRYQIDFLEAINHRFMRYLSRHTDTPMNRFDHDYSPISKKFSIPSIKSIHDYFDLCTVHKIIHHLFSSVHLFNLFQTRPNPYSLRTAHPLHTSIFLRDSNFSSSIPRLCRLWNSIQADNRELSILQFKHFAKSHCYRFN